MEKLLQREAWITETKSNDATLPGDGGNGGGGELDYGMKKKEGEKEERKRYDQSFALIKWQLLSIVFETINRVKRCATR